MIAIITQFNTEEELLWSPVQRHKAASYAKVQSSNCEHLPENIITTATELISIQPVVPSKRCHKSENVILSHLTGDWNRTVATKARGLYGFLFFNHHLAWLKIALLQGRVSQARLKIEISICISLISLKILVAWWTRVLIQ